MIIGLIALVLPMTQSRAGLPVLHLTPTAAAVGEQVSVTGSDLPEKATLALSIDGSAAGLPQVRVSPKGTVAAVFTVPAVGTGNHTLTAETVQARGKSVSRSSLTLVASATFTVVASNGESGSADPTATVGGTPTSNPTATATPTGVPTGTPTASPTPLVTAAPTPLVTPDPTPARTPAPTPAPTATPAPPKTASGVPAIPGGGKVLFNAATGSLGYLRPETYPNDHPGDGMIACGTFTANPQYFPIYGGALHLRTQKVNGQWLQTFLTTRTTFAQKYGIFRAALQWDNGYQLWPSFWLYDPKWSAAEIDAVENHPNPDNPNNWGFNMHPGTYGKNLLAPSNHTTTWHVYEVEWRATFVAVRIDGVEKARFTSGAPSVPLFAAFDMKLGTPWLNECPNSTTPTMAELRVAWLQVAP